jgi:hypothetical protein
MLRTLSLATLAALLAVSPARAAVTGNYVEVRNADVWTGPCFANAEGNLTGKNAALVWNIAEGTYDGVRLDGLTIVAVVQASDTLAFEQTGPAAAVLIVDDRATEMQKLALVRLAQRQGGELLKNVVRVESARINVDICGCKGEGCAEIDAGPVRIKTRCLNTGHDKACGNETAYYPPLVAGVRCVPAVADHRYTGAGLGMTWSENERRGAYVGTFGAR